MSAIPASSAKLRVVRGAREIAERGKAIGLPMIATCADIAARDPCASRVGRGSRRSWRKRAWGSSYAGSNEIQRNIIAKAALGL